MRVSAQRAAEIAQDFCGASSPLERLGWGVGGFVYLSPKPGRVVKVHHGHHFGVELEVYQRLRRMRMTQLHGLHIPRLLSAREDYQLLEMDFVSAPYLLDFAGVLFAPPDYPEDAMEKWHADIAEAYGPNATLAYAVYHSLEQHGLWYMDFRPSNMKLDGLPGLEPYTPPSIDDLPW